MDYEISVSELSEFRRGVDVKIPRTIFESRMKKAIDSLTSRVEIKGFRKGKAPAQVVRKMYGDRIKLDVLEEIWRDAYKEVITERSLEVVGVSNLHFHDEDSSTDLKIEAEFALFPRPTFNNLNNLEVQVETEKFTDKLVSDAEDEILRRSGKIAPIEGRDHAETGDLLNISYTATIDGNEFAGSTDDNAYVEIGSGRSVKDLEEGLIGQKVGTERELSVKFPDDYPDKSIAGKTAQYKVAIKTMEKVEIPQLTDEFVKENLNEESVEKFKEKLTKRLERRIEERNHNAQIDAVVKAVYEANKFEVPAVMIDEQIRGKLFEFGILNPKDDGAYRQDVSRFRPLVGESAEKEVQKAIILESLVEQLKIEVSDTDVDSWAEKQAVRYETTADDIRDEFDFKKNPKRLKDVVAREKAVEQILSQSKVIEQPKA